MNYKLKIKNLIFIKYYYTSKSNLKVTKGRQF